MERKKLISVIVPIYKVEQYLDECIGSIVNQTYKNLEIILVDDGSPDDCPAKCDEWAKRDNRIRVVHKKNGGLSSARNAGLNMATGEYVSFVDSDDFICQDALQNLYDRFQGNDAIGIVSGMIYRYQNGKISKFKEKWFIAEEKTISAKDFLLQTISQKTSYTVWNKLYRTNILDGVRFREGRNNEDTLFMYELGRKIYDKNISMIEIPHYVYYYRYREESICTTSKVPLAIDILNNLEFMMRDCELFDRPLYDVLYEQYVKTLFIFVDSLLLNPVWKSLYFSKYQSQLRKIPLGIVFKYFSFNDVVYVELLKWLPSLRMAVKYCINRDK